MNETRGPATQRIHELDSLRGIAALGVVLWHYGQFFDVRPLSPIFAPFYNAGFLLVDFFFVLSGYVIARAYWRDERRQRLSRNIQARIARLYPLHLATLLLTIAVAFLAGDALHGYPLDLQNDNLWHFVLNLLLLNQVGLQDGWSFNVPAWSISTEFIANLAFLVFISISVRARFALVAVVVAVLVGLAAWGMPLVGERFVLGVLDLNLTRCLAGFALGVGIYLVLERWGLSAWLSKHRLLAEAAALLSLSGITALLLVSHRHPPITHYLAAMLLAGGCVLFVPFSRGLAQMLRVTPLVWLGERSYSVYLVHYPAVLVLMALGAGTTRTPDFANPLTLACYLIAVLLVSTLAYRYIEQPGQRMFLQFRRETVRPLGAL